MSQATIDDVKRNGFPTAAALRRIAVLVMNASPAARPRMKALEAREHLDYYGKFTAVRQGIVIALEDPKLDVSPEDRERLRRIIVKFPVEFAIDRAESDVVSVKFPLAGQLARVDECAARDGVTRNAWMLAAVMAAVEASEAARRRPANAQ